MDFLQKHWKRWGSIDQHMHHATVGAFFFLQCMRKALVMLVVPFLLLSACKRGLGEEESIGKEVIVTPMPVGREVRDPDHGREAWLAVGPVEGMETPANGVATAHYFEDGAYILGMQVNIAPPEEGFFYEAWLPIGSASPEWMSVGHLQNPHGDVRHELRFEASKDLREYRDISLTREPDDGNPEPGTVVATARLIQRRR